MRFNHTLAISLPLLLGSASATAYIGPGLGAGTLGVILGLLGSILLALFAFFWYPIKRALFGAAKEKVEESDSEVESSVATKVTADVEDK